MTNENFIEDPKEYVDSIAKEMILSGCIQVFIGLLFIILGMIAKIIQYDVIYWPPIFVFSLENMFRWVIFGSILIILSILQIIIAIKYRKNVKEPEVQKYVKIVIIFELLFIPIGTILAIMELFQIADMKKIISLEKINNKNLKQDIGFATIFTAIINSGIFFTVYLLTKFLSTMMLDVTYPFLTMGVLSQIRLILYILFAIQAIQILFGVLYTKNYINPLIKTLAYIIGIYQLILFPIGTYAGALLLRDLRYDLEIKKSENPRKQ